MQTYRWHLPWTFSTFDYRSSCDLLKAAVARRPVRDRQGRGPRRRRTIRHTDRGDLSAPAGRRRPGLAAHAQRAAARYQPPEARLSRGLEVHPDGIGERLEIWLDPEYVRAGYAWSFPAGDEVRVGVGSFDPRDHVKEPTTASSPTTSGREPTATRATGSPTSCARATEDGSSSSPATRAGHCLPTTAEGIRTALYFGIACGRELREVVEGRQTRAQALERYAAFCDEHPARSAGCGSCRSWSGA